MGTTVEVWSADEDGAYATRDLFDHVERVASRFRPDSDLSQVNQDPASSVEVSPELAELVEAAARVRMLTGGLVDAGMGSVVAAWGYDRTFTDVVDLTASPASPGDLSWFYDPVRRLLTRPPGVLMDLGGVAKGWTADRAIELGLATVVSAGGDIRSVDPETTVDLEDPFGGPPLNLPLGTGALATSSTLKRAWRAGERRVSHLIDPRSGEPVDSPVVSATAIAETAVLAEAAAKAVLIRGQDGLVWAEAAPWVTWAMTVWETGSMFSTVPAGVGA